MKVKATRVEGLSKLNGDNAVKRRVACPTSSVVGHALVQIALPSLHPLYYTSHSADTFTMSQAHRPTWNPTQGRETKAGSQQISKLSAASHTKLKFRQPGQTSTSDVARRDLKAELIEAERVAADKKRKAAGLPALPAPASALRLESGKGDAEEEERVKRRKVLEEALAADRDDDEDDEYDEGLGDEVVDKGKGKASVIDADDEDEEEDDDE